MVSDWWTGLLSHVQNRLNPCCNGIWSQTCFCHYVILTIMCLNPCCNGIWSQTSKTRSWRGRCLNPCCNGIWSQTGSETFGLQVHNCLNPCCNGIWSQTTYHFYFSSKECLNPCCNGIWSQTSISYNISDRPHVLILVVMEYGLRQTLHDSLIGKTTS